MINLLLIKLNKSLNHHFIIIIILRNFRAYTFKIEMQQFSILFHSECTYTYGTLKIFVTEPYDLILATFEQLI